MPAKPKQPAAAAKAKPAAKPAAKPNPRKGNGAGWGGPAKGAGNGKPKQDFNATTNPQAHNGHTDPALVRVERRRERADRMEELLFDLAKTGERDQDRINAAKALHAICDGLPVARQEVRVSKAADDMTDEELDAAIAAAQRQAR